MRSSLYLFAAAQYREERALHVHAEHVVDLCSLRAAAHGFLMQLQIGDRPMPHAKINGTHASNLTHPARANDALLAFLSTLDR